MLSPETIEMLQRGGSFVLLVIAIGFMNWDRNRLLGSLKAKDELIAKKDAQLLSVTKETITVLSELKWLMGGRGGGK